MAAPTTTTADEAVARHAIAQHDFTDEADLRLINVSENTTYLVTEGDRSGIVRVHREGYHTSAAIHSELAWMAALRTDAGLATSTAVPTPDGRTVISVESNGRLRHAVLFEVAPGVEPDGNIVRSSDFQTLGALTARMHQHSKSWKPPTDFTRFAWDWRHTLGTEPRWGRWRDGIGVTASDATVLGRAADLVKTQLAQYGQAPDRYGLVHADLRLANLLVRDDLVTVIDFDDCGWSWFMYDFGTAVSFLEDDPRLPEWQDAWAQGYRTVAPLAAEHEAMLATFTMMRRLLLVAWMGSHSHSRECQQLGPAYTHASLQLADRYLSSAGATLH